MNDTTYITARARPFACEPMQAYRFAVDADGIVRVYDSVADHYTRCHSLSERQQRRIRRLADQYGPQRQAPTAQTPRRHEDWMISSTRGHTAGTRRHSTKGR